MTISQVNKGQIKMRMYHYLLISIGILLTTLLAIGVVYFWEELQYARGYGYVGGFLVAVIGGVMIIPIANFPVIFILGHALNPVYVGLVAGLGEAIGGMTVYLTGAGGSAIWSRLQSRNQGNCSQPGSGQDSLTRAESKVWAKGQALYNRLAARIGQRGISWLVFITSAFAWHLAYFAGLTAGGLRMDIKRFFLVTWAGKTVKGFIIAFAGHWGLYFLLRWIGG